MEKMEETTTEKKAYEISFLAKEEGDSERVSTLLKQHSATITLDGQTRKIALSYKINKETHAFFGYFQFEANPEDIGLLERALQTNSSIIRFLIITPPFVKQKPTTFNKFRSKAPTDKVSEEEIAPKSSLPLSNEALEKKIEEILQ